MRVSLYKWISLVPAQLDWQTPHSEHKANNCNWNHYNLMILLFKENYFMSREGRTVAKNGPRWLRILQLSFLGCELIGLSLWPCVVQTLQHCCHVTDLIFRDILPSPLQPSHTKLPLRSVKSLVVEEGGAILLRRKHRKDSSSVSNGAVVAGLLSQ